MNNQPNTYNNQDAAEIRKRLDAYADSSVCRDCGLPYEKFGMDTTIPNLQWETIHPGSEGGGLLCANCMVRRGSKIPGVIAARMVFEIASSKEHYCQQCATYVDLGYRRITPDGLDLEPGYYCIKCVSNRKRSSDER